MGARVQTAHDVVVGHIVHGVPAAGLNFYPTLVSFTPNITARELTY